MRTVISLLVLLFSPLWPIGFAFAVAHGAFQGGYDAAVKLMQQMVGE